MTAVGGAEGSVGSTGSPSRAAKPSASRLTRSRRCRRRPSSRLAGLPSKYRVAFEGVASRDWEAFG